MPEYKAPIEEMKFLLKDAIGFDGIEGADILDDDTIEAILNEAGKLATDVLSPLNHYGDRNPPTWKDGNVTTPKGWKDAYLSYCEGGWNAVPFDPEYEGQGLPWLLAFPIQEMWQSANMAFGLCPLLNQGAIEAIDAHGSEEQKQLYLPKLISGEWSGTMNLTEPQAGSDLSAIRSRAVPQDDGSYKISGQKIFITYGEHDLTENIIHLVLARTPDAPEGVKGISLFIVPKFIPGANGDIGQRNDLTCASIEHKLGIHASPTCTMVFGDNGGAVGYLIGEENQGLKYMFTMMNNARLSVGLQGIAIAERAYQGALGYSLERVQGRHIKTGDNAPIYQHADIQNMLFDMRGKIQAARFMAYEAAKHLDLASQGSASAKARVGVLTPIIKAWSTDIAVDVTSTAIQVFGGMGYVEETGAAQHYRDARILPIYEGTNGIQAADLVFRKVLFDGGNAFSEWISDQKTKMEALRLSDNQLPEAFSGYVEDTLENLVALEETGQMILRCGGDKQLDGLAFIATEFLNMCGLAAGCVSHLLLAHKSLKAEHYTHFDVALYFLAKNSTRIRPCKEVIEKLIKIKPTLSL